MWTLFSAVAFADPPALVALVTSQLEVKAKER
jgi:hypothetical protein